MLEEGILNRQSRRKEWVFKLWVCTESEDESTTLEHKIYGRWKYLHCKPHTGIFGPGAQPPSDPTNPQGLDFSGHTIKLHYHQSIASLSNAQCWSRKKYISL